MNYKKSISSLLTVVALFSSVSPALAVGPVKEHLQEARQELKEGKFKEAKSDVKCSVITSKLNARIKNLNARKDIHIEVYTRMSTRLTKLVADLDAKGGYDTAKVKSDIKALNTKIAKLKADYATFVAKIEATKNLDCADAEGKFKDSLKDSKGGLEAVRLESKDIKDFYQNTVKPDVQALRKQQTDK